MSKIETNTIAPSTGTTLTLGESGDTVQVGSGVTATGFGGITVADNWRLSSDVTSDTSPLTNWEQNDTAGAGQIGTSMSVSSGAFTFPSTGIYLVTLTAIITEGTAADNLVQIDGYFNSVRMMQIFLHVNNGSDMSTGSNQAIIDVDDVSKTFYVNFVNNTSSGSLRGSTDTNMTNIVFTRLGDT
jgi:hypothetical protein